VQQSENIKRVKLTSSNVLPFPCVKGEVEEGVRVEVGEGGGREGKKASEVAVMAMANFVMLQKKDAWEKNGFRASAVLGLDCPQNNPARARCLERLERPWVQTVSHSRHHRFGQELLGLCDSR